MTHKRNKLTPCQEARLRKERWTADNGKLPPLKQLAHKYGVSISTVSKIANGGTR